MSRSRPTPAVRTLNYNYIMKGLIQCAGVFQLAAITEQLQVCKVKRVKWYQMDTVNKTSEQ